MDNSEKILAIDIGGTSIKIGVVMNDMVIESTSIRNIFKGKSEDLVSGIKDYCNEYILKYGISKIGIGCPGDILNGVVIFASNLGWKNFEILKEFQREFPTQKINVDNDGNAAAQAEIKFGHLNNVENGLFITIGRGIGGAIISKHHIIHGVHNRGGRIGHMVIHTGGRRCNCGRRGCFETYGSVLGLIRTVKDENLKAKVEDQINVEKLSGYQIVQHKKNNNKVAIEGIRKWHIDVSEGLLNLCNIFDPEVIVIAGGITESGLLDIDFINDFLSKQGYTDCDVKVAKFKGKTGLVGAAALLDE